MTVWTLLQCDEFLVCEHVRANCENALVCRVSRNSECKIAGSGATLVQGAGVVEAVFQNSHGVECVDGAAICGLAIRILGDSGVAAGCLINVGANHCDEYDYHDDAECCGLLESREASPRFALGTPSEGCSGTQYFLDQWLEQSLQDSFGESGEKEYQGLKSLSEPE